MRTNFSSLIILCSAFILASCANTNLETDPGREIGSLKVSKEKPQPGDELTLTYQFQNNKLDGESEVFYHYFVGPKAYIQDLELKDSADTWKANFKVPDSATAVAFHISKNGKWDNNNKKGFVLTLFDSEGNVLPGSKASQGLFYVRYGNEYGITNDLFLSMITEDLEKHPELKKEWDEIYARLLYDANKQKGTSYITQRLKERGDKNTDAKDLAAIYQFHNILKNNEAADSVQQIIAEKFPRNELALQKQLNDFRKITDINEREIFFLNFHENIGVQDSSFQKNYMLNILAHQFTQNEDWEKLDKYLSMMNDKAMQSNFLNNLAWEMAQTGKNLEKASELSAMSIEFYKKAKKPEHQTQNQFKKSREYTIRMFLDTYAYIFMKQGNFEEAIKHQEKAVADGKNSEYNERYMEMLIANKEYEKALNSAEKFIITNAATAKTKDFYKTAFVKIKASTEGYNERLASLENMARQKAMADLQKEMLDEDAPDFKLHDLEGNEVSLASLKGKAVILDFWATWCGPCVASFPGMQTAVDTFKSDEHVIFLFVNTMESGAKRQENVQEFISQNNYSFHVLMDEPTNEGSNKFATALAYNVNGIPTKVIIGPDGKMRFKKVGYGGNNEQMVQELMLMVDLLKETKTADGKPSA